VPASETDIFANVSAPTNKQPTRAVTNNIRMLYTYFFCTSEQRRRASVRVAEHPGKVNFLTSKVQG
jgi:hypothetical protein